MVYLVEVNIKSQGIIVLLLWVIIWIITDILYFQSIIFLGITNFFLDIEPVELIDIHH